jgi:hypothetical protein
MVAVIAESGRSKSGQFAEMAAQFSRFCKVPRTCSQSYPQKMGVELFHARVDTLQLIEILSLFMFPAGSCSQ